MTLGGVFLGFSFFLNGCVFVVHGGERGVLFNKFKGGIGDKVYGEGMHLKIPFVQEEILLNIRMNPHTFQMKGKTNDLQEVDLKIRILEKPKEKYIARLYLQQGKDYAKKTLQNTIVEIMKSTVAHYSSEQLFTLREKISREIHQLIAAKAEEFDIIVEDSAILSISFNQSFIDAVEKKVEAIQYSERKQYEVKISEEERKITIISAEAESESAKIFNDAISKYGASYLQLKNMENSVSVVENYCKSPNLTFLAGSGSGEKGNYLIKI